MEEADRPTALLETPCDERADLPVARLRDHADRRPSVEESSERLAQRATRKRGFSSSRVAVAIRGP